MESNGKLRILFFAPKSPPIGGIASWFDLIYTKKAASCEYDFVNSSVSIKRQYAKGIRKMILGILEYNKQFKVLSSKVKKGSFDILHIATSGGNGFKRDKRFIDFAHKHKMKVVVHLHFGRVKDLFENKTNETNLLISVLTKADYVIAIDKTTYEVLGDNGYGQKASFVPNPISTNDYHYDINSKKIIYVGTLNKNKGIIELISAFNSLSNKYPNWTLDLFGPMDNEPDMLDFIRNNKNANIVFKGEVKRDVLLNQYHFYSFIVLPSYTEGMPYCLLEAMSYGVPPIATAVGNIPNMIDDDRVLILPKSSEQLKTKIEEFILNPSLRVELSNKLYQKTTNYYSIDRINEMMINIWRKIV